jgi:DNA polymerase/3'-5' exonuclease PolX
MDFNKPVIKYLQTFLDKEENAFKKKAYQTAIKNLSGVQINSIQDVIVIKGIGVKIREKIQYVIDNFDPETIDEPLDNIYGIGPAKLKQLKEKGINTFQKLKDALVLDSKLLNAKQKIGLQYYDDIETRIPYKEVIEHDKYLRKVILENSKVETIDIVGSYRRKKQSSGDIDLLVKIKNKDDYIGILKEIVEKLTNYNYILEVLACKDKKFMGIVKMGTIARRLDMLITYPEEYACALLYFTGSKEHNIKIRNKALKLGYTLNEHRMEKIKKNSKDVPYFNTEKDIFDFLEMDYVEPHLRD